MNEPRYSVCSITGYNDDSRSVTTTYWIADRLYGFREVVIVRQQRGRGRAAAQRIAERRCAELNAEHEAIADVAA